jgi:hypothetical protein
MLKLIIKFKYLIILAAEEGSHLSQRQVTLSNSSEMRFLVSRRMRKIWSQPREISKCYLLLCLIFEVFSERGMSLYFIVKMAVTKEVSVSVVISGGTE